jgi:hypothetical protein
MLLKTFQSQPFLYRLPSVISGGAQIYHSELTTPPRIYGEEYDGGGVTVIFLNQEPLVDGYEVIYLFITQNMVFFPGYNYALHRFNATTGEYLGRFDADPTLFIFSRFTQALDNTIYRCDVALKITKCQIDPVVGVTSDGVEIYDLSTFAGVTSIDAFSLYATSNVALICANVANQLRVHDLNTGALLRTVTLPASGVQVMPEDSERCYVMSANHVMCLIDYSQGTVLSAFKIQDDFDPSLPGVTVTWDTYYRRFLSWVDTPVDTTGQNTSTVNGYFPLPQAVGLTAPIPLKPPRKYSSTPIYTRLFGDLGEPVGGVQIVLTPDSGIAAVVGFPAITDTDGEAIGTIIDVDSGSLTLTATAGLVGPIITPALLPVWTDPFPAGTVALLYTYQLSGYGGVVPYAWACPGLPPGLTIDAGSGIITGTPTTPITNLALFPTITDSASPPVTKSLPSHITINPSTGGGPLTELWPDPIPSGDVGSPYSYFLTASGGIGLGYVYSLVSGVLPVGITLNTATGEVSSGGLPLTTAIFFDAVEFGVTG